MNSGKTMIEFYVKNIICELFEEKLRNMIKSESPDFYNDEITLEITIPMEEEDAEYQFLFQKYKGKNINEIPEKVFKQVHCDKTKIEKIGYDNLFGIKNKNNYLKFIFDDEKRWLFYIHNSLSMQKISKLVNESIFKKTKKLNDNYFKRKYNYLAILIQTTFFNIEEEIAISNVSALIKNSNQIKHFQSLFDKLFLLFYDAAFEIDIHNSKSNKVMIDKITRDKVIQYSEKESEKYN